MDQGGKTPPLAPVYEDEFNCHFCPSTGEAHYAKEVDGIYYPACAKCVGLRGLDAD